MTLRSHHLESFLDLTCSSSVAFGKPVVHRVLGVVLAMHFLIMGIHTESWHKYHNVGLDRAMWHHFLHTWAVCMIYSVAHMAVVSKAL